MTTLVWFRQDLRLEDNSALKAAIDRGKPILPIYILDDDAAGPHAPGGAARWWLHHSLAGLTANLEDAGARLILRRGNTAQILDDVTKDAQVEAVYWNRRYAPFAIEQDTQIKNDLKARGLDVQSFRTSLLFEPWTVETNSAGPYRVFTPFAKACRAKDEPETPFARPVRIPVPESWPHSDALEDWALLPRRPNWAAGWDELWTPGEQGARARLDEFLADHFIHYAASRDRPDRDGTSRLSPSLHLGEIGPRQVWHAVRAHAAASDSDDAGRSETKFLSEVLWREFSYHLLYHYPHLPRENFNDQFDAFPWRDRTDYADDLAAWQQGRTGYPIVDAGMRQLWQTGWMHNRVRMIVGSLLTKHLLIPWQEGERWFWDTLIDADEASNSASWQWISGSGADAAPYFRVFNPMIQGAKFDPNGDYVRRYVPEIAKLPTKVLHAPWEADAATLERAGVRLGETYPRPIVEHQAGRTRALEAYEEIKKSAA